MKFSIFKSTEASRQVAATVAAALGQTYQPNAFGSGRDQILTIYFEDIARALAPRFDHLRMAEFTRRRLNAYADLDAEDRPYIHIDQQLDMWLLAATQLVGIRAFYAMEGDNQRSINTLFERVMSMDTDPTMHESTREDMLHLYIDFKDTLRITHHIGVASLVFVACHELAHHAHGDDERTRGHEMEFEADHAAWQLFQETYAARSRLQVIRPMPYAPVGIWMILILMDLVERMACKRKNLWSRPVSGTHPFAADRLSRLMPLLLQDQETVKFIAGFEPSVTAFRRDLQLDRIG